MDKLWKRLEDYLEVNAPVMRECLANGATEAELTELEAAVGHTLPSDVRLSLLRHNGQNLVNGDPGGGTLIPCGFRLLTLSDMLVEWTEHRNVAEYLKGERDPEIANPGVKPFFHHPAWIPIAADIGGNSICVDLDPGEGGSVGQIIEFNHDLDTPTRIAADYKSWLMEITDGLEAGQYIYENNSYYPGFFLPEDLSSFGVAYSPTNP
ncbi:hypothetical protein CCAX7_007980 [Capsulimonas corticalis]|uniref:Uncharacterized protein n=1 Tax=Capsulimonas corticalis TaxID=2219043 RepID=A0A402CTT3_9BACT|nr:SMI1/KNR4 family protein [Capsulimonas corticalis]BDI28747.1 hypothetical protein CCAX7_007980 [Capsulimonas corticalis]